MKYISVNLAVARYSVIDGVVAAYLVVALAYLILDCNRMNCNISLSADRVSDQSCALVRSGDTFKYLSLLARLMCVMTSKRPQASVML